VMRQEPHTERECCYGMNGQDHDASCLFSKVAMRKAGQAVL
jgi:hypothetical protein